MSLASRKIFLYKRFLLKMLVSDINMPSCLEEVAIVYFLEEINLVSFSDVSEIFEKEVAKL